MPKEENAPFLQSSGQNLLKTLANRQKFSTDMWLGGKKPSRQMRLGVVRAKPPLDKIINIPPRTFDLFKPCINRK